MSNLATSPVATVPSRARMGTVPIILQCNEATAGPAPITVGVPFPRGMLIDAESLDLLDHRNNERPLQTRVLARWPDGSVKWLLLDFLADGLSSGKSEWRLQLEDKVAAGRNEALDIRKCEQGCLIDTGKVVFEIGLDRLGPLRQVSLNGRRLLDARQSQVIFKDLGNRPAGAIIHGFAVEENGPVRATLRLDAKCTGKVRARLQARLSFFARTGLVRLRLTMHNPNRARHAGGMWDLGDPGSMLFRALLLEMNLVEEATQKLSWTTGGDLEKEATDALNLEIYQDSSGGENWLSRNHINRHGRVPCSFRGYRVRTGQRETFGHRASPIVGLHGPAGGATVALPEFWQQFPRAMEVDGRCVRVGFFPEQSADGHELQGGERKTHTLWLDFSDGAQTALRSLEWVHTPIQVSALPEWIADSGALGPSGEGFESSAGKLDELLAGAVSGPRSLIARREIIDEYGWRNFGELYADHEAENYKGPAPVISHYNNQYDCVLGALMQYLRTADQVWWQIADPLARHVMDIDRYHTTRDKAAYNGGLFWFTDHYLSAETSTHRSYSRLNRPAGQDYGGGPSSNHNFTSGLLLYYYLTGDAEARAAVIGLADWVIAMDDGRKNILGWVDPGPTGSASCTGNMDYHGPGRGPGNSINALLDAYLLTARESYLDTAEALIRRCIHPDDDIAAHDLLNVEKRWSYTVFLVALDRYVRLKAERSEQDESYAYARESLRAYAAWMLEHEKPYFDQREKLEFPTEAWAGQELRKANVMRLAAVHADEPLRSALRRRGDALAERGWRDLMAFASRDSARALALVMVEGLMDRALHGDLHVPDEAIFARRDHGLPVTFVPQKQRVLKSLTTLRGLVSMLFRGIPSPDSRRTPE